MKTISERALVKRINRKLAHDGERLRALRGVSQWADLGTFYITCDRVIVAKHVDPEALGRELGVLRPNEGIGGAL